MINFIYFVIIIVTCIWLGVVGQHDSQVPDAFDEIRMRIDNVNKANCRKVRVQNLFLPPESVSDLPDITKLNVNPIFPNRFSLLHLHNMALSRSFFWSYLLQSRFIRPAVNNTYDPGMMYYFLSTVADVSANPQINASATYFAPNRAFSSSYRGFFNKTFRRFAPRAFRADDFNDPIHYEKVSTMNMFHVKDLGATLPGWLSEDYTDFSYTINKWYSAWLPDERKEVHDSKTTYQVEIRYANNTNETFTFHGPPDPSETPGPVKWMQPYFDCGRTNRWMVAAVVPIVDLYPRHTGFRHIEYPTYTAVSVVEMDFERIDINQCPLSPENPGPNYFNDTARCKKDTTECEALHGWGFRRGGYQCKCLPGHRLPSRVNHPYLGEMVERATDELYYSTFNCEKVLWKQRDLIRWDKMPAYTREKYLEQHQEYSNVSYGEAALHTNKKNIHEILKFIKHFNNQTCLEYLKSHPEIELPGDISYGSDEFFEGEARMAARLANFISAFLQISSIDDYDTGKYLPDTELTEDEMIAETLSLLFGNSRIWGAGTYWAKNKFPKRKYFAPYAYKTQLNTRKYYLEDEARLAKSEKSYIHKKWFKDLQERWKANYDELEEHHLKLQMRNNESGTRNIHYSKPQTFYKAANLDQGLWTNPYFDCKGKKKDWVITYASPFFGFIKKTDQLEFKGVVTVTMLLDDLNINQCDDKYHVPNAFKNTHKCDRKSSYCVPLLDKGFNVGGYKCECKQAYEYQYDHSYNTFYGDVMESEFIKIFEDKETRYDMLKCRLAGAASVQSSLLLIITGLVLFFRLLSK